jgi:hypothetical protein
MVGIRASAESGGARLALTRPIAGCSRATPVRGTGAGGVTFELGIRADEYTRTRRTCARECGERDRA